MQGVITSRDVLRHLPLIWREFGTGCVVRCLGAVLSQRSCTFLELSQKPLRAPRGVALDDEGPP